MIILKTFNMKKLLFFINLFLLSSFSKSYSQCLLNGDFSQFVNPNNTAPCNTGGDCPTFSNQCLTNWVRLYGTPQLVVPTPSNTVNNYIYMWQNKFYGSPNYGEGILGKYNFIAHQNYRIQIRISGYAHPGAATTGGLNISAANNLVESTSSHTCGDEYSPRGNPISANQLVNTGAGNWQTFTYSYTPDLPYSQITISPFSTSENQYDLNVDFINICPDNCNGITDYSTVVFIPTGYTRAGFIRASNGFTDGALATNFIAGREISLKPDFIAGATGSGYFHAAIGGCNSASARGAKDENQIDITAKRDNINTLKYNVDDNFKKVEIQNISKVYPNPAKDKIIINYNFEINTKGEIKIINSIGTVVMKLITNSLNQKQIEINVKNFSDGVYFIIIKSGTKVYREKFIKIK